jgi:hypothetical protein
MTSGKRAKRACYEGALAIALVLRQMPMLTLVKYQKTPIHPFGLNATLDVFNTDICMKLFNTTSLKFNEQDGANM